MRRIIRNGIFLIPFFLFMSTVSAVPVLPAEYYGTVVINGNPAPAGTEISALINDTVVGNLILTSAGSYGGTGTFDPRLVVSGTGDGETIVFAINGKPADQTSIFHPGDLRQLSLSVSLVSSTSTTLAATASPTVTATTIFIETTTSPVPTTTAAITSASQTTTRVPSATTPVLTETTEPRMNTPTTAEPKETSPAGSGLTSPIPSRESVTQPAGGTGQPSGTQASGFSAVDAFGILLLVTMCGVILRK